MSGHGEDVLDCFDDPSSKNQELKQSITEVVDVLQRRPVARSLQHVRLKVPNFDSWIHNEHKLHYLGVNLKLKIIETSVQSVWIKKNLI